MKDDRCGDGQVMQLDQCLSCSRYEPIIGQTYDILNELGTNLANVQDDCQMGYMNMKEYLDFVRVERMHAAKDNINLSTVNLTTRDPNEKDFKGQWDKGISMSWKLTPVELQRPQINWRPDINHADKAPKPLASYQMNNGVGGSGMGGNLTIKAGNFKEWMQRHYDNMMAAPSGTLLAEERDGDIADYNCEQRVQTTIDNMNAYGWQQELQNQCAQQGIDPLLMFAITAEEAGGYPEAAHTEGGCWGMFQSDTCPSTNPAEQIADAIGKIKGKFEMTGGGDNPIAGVQAYCSWFPEWQAQFKDNALYDDAWLMMVIDDGSGNVMVRKRFFGCICTIYILAMKANTGLSQLEQTNVPNGFGFPFDDEKNAKVYFIQDYGSANIDAGITTMSGGIVFKCPDGSELHAPFDGTVEEMDGESSDCRFIKMKNSLNGSMIIYKYINSLANKSFESISKGQVVATTTDTLYLQYVDAGGNLADPKLVYPLLSGKVSTEKTLGEQVGSNIVTQTTGTDYKIAAQGDGTYNQDDPKNWQ